jgi:putative hydrolase of the HAD superfamily
MAPHVQAVLFDYGLVLTGPPDPAAWQRMAEITGLSEDALRQAYWAPRHDYDRGTHNGRTYWRTVGQHAGLALTEPQIDALVAADTALWTQPNQPMIDFAARLHTAGTPTGILSNLGDEMMHGILAKLPWLEDFSHKTWSHTLNLAKPEPAIYAHAAAGLNLPPSHILFIDDREDNIAGALASGMQAIRYTTQPEFEQEIQNRGLSSLWTTGRV